MKNIPSRPTSSRQPQQPKPKEYTTRQDYNPDRELPQQYYSWLTPNLPENFMNECIDIIEKLDKRQHAKSDVVNWDERVQMDEATKRSGHLLPMDEADTSYTDHIPTGEEIKERKTAKTTGKQNLQENRRAPAAPPRPPVTKKEQDLMDYLGGVMSLLGDE